MTFIPTSKSRIFWAMMKPSLIYALVFGVMCFLLWHRWAMPCDMGWHIDEMPSYCIDGSSKPPIFYASFLVPFVSLFIAALINFVVFIWRKCRHDYVVMLLPSILFLMVYVVFNVLMAEWDIRLNEVFYLMIFYLILNLPVLILGLIHYLTLKKFSGSLKLN